MLAPASNWRRQRPDTAGRTACPRSLTATSAAKNAVAMTSRNAPIQYGDRCAPAKCWDVPVVPHSTAADNARAMPGQDAVFMRPWWRTRRADLSRDSRLGVGGVAAWDRRLPGAVSVRVQRANTDRPVAPQRMRHRARRRIAHARRRRFQREAASQETLGLVQPQ